MALLFTSILISQKKLMILKQTMLRLYQDLIFLTQLVVESTKKKKHQKRLTYWMSRFLQSRLSESMVSSNKSHVKPGQLHFKISS